ncbi:MAG: hypothetical protein GY774_06070 [Planctomycetes bacterium]|nr:hypothetical protein [Planctomycetota bacterium]
MRLLIISFVVVFFTGSYVYGGEVKRPPAVHPFIHPVEDEGNDNIDNNNNNNNNANANAATIEEDSTDMTTFTPTTAEDESREVGAGIEEVIMDAASGRSFQYAIVGLALTLAVAISLLVGWCVQATRRRCRQRTGRRRSFELAELANVTASGGNAYTLPPPRSSSPSRWPKKKKKNVPLPPPPTAHELDRDGFYEVPLHSRQSSATSLPPPSAPPTPPPSSSSGSETEVFTCGAIPKKLKKK